jgi:hypothetical protein
MHIEKSLSDAHRSNITFTPNGVFKQDASLQVEGVKTYGKAWGRLLKCFGFASAIHAEGKMIYVNTASLIKHMAEVWAKQINADRGWQESAQERLKRKFRGF